MAAMLAILAFTAFQSDADAQARRGESRSTGTSRATSVTRTTPSGTRSSGTSANRSTVSQDRKVSATRPSSQTARPSSQTTRPSSQVTRPSAATRPSAGTTPKVDKNERKPSTTVRRPSETRPVTADRQTSVKRPSASSKQPVTVTRPGNRTDRPSRPEVKPNDGRPSVRPDAGRGNPAPKVERDRPNRPERPDRPNKPVQVRPNHKPDVHRVHPRDRGFVDYHRPAHYWTGHNHCFGHRVRILPSHARRHIHFGVTYYCYNDIWYRPYGGYYVVCRPPFGTILAANLIADMTWTAVRLSYYYTVANTYSRINENNEHIARQNEIIAQNNATIAAQNQAIAMNQQLASQAYSLANELGLVQSYAAAGSDYYYQDGVFYSMDSDGEYKVIVPPAGAMVETLPEDYDMVTLNGDEYYKVDDTVYRVTISEGKPYFEVLGQLYA